MIYLIWGITLAIKLALSAWYPLFQDEMYYWVWAQHPALSYFDHPPFVAWLIRAGLPLQDFGSAVRWPTVLFGHMALLIWLTIVKDRLSPKSAILYCLLFSLAPLTGLGTIIATPDVPLLVFWSLAVLAFIEALQTEKWRWFIALGISAGLGFCSKYHMVLLMPLSLLCFYLTKQRATQYAKLSVSVVLALLFSAPVFIWNYQHDWASFSFQLQRGLGRQSDIQWFFEYICAQLAMMLPFVLLAAYQGSKDKKNIVFTVFGWGPILFFLLSSLKGRVEANWTTIAYPSLFFLCVSTGEKWQKRLQINAAVWAIAFCLLISHLFYRWLPIDDKTLKLNEYYAFDSYLNLFNEYQPIYASSYQMAATASYKLKKPVYKLRGIHRRDQFDMLPQSMPTTDTFYLLRSAWNDHPEWLDKNYSVMSRLGPYPPFSEDMFLYRFKKKETK